MSVARVLVVDDKGSFCQLLRRILPSELDVVSAADGDAALELLGREGFDLVIADVRMPRMDGLTLLERVRRTDAKTEVILMTAYGTIPSAVAAMKLGAFEYLTKPFDPDVMLSAVSRALSRSGKTVAADAPAPLTYREALDADRGRAVKSYLVGLLKDTSGNVTVAAERAGIERESMHRLLRRHGLKSEDFRTKR